MQLTFSQIVKTSSSSLMLAILLASPVLAADGDAAEIFAIAASGAFTFNGQRVVDDVSLSFMHFTKAGRQAVISELQRTGVISQAMMKKGALKAFSSGNKFVSTRRVGRGGVDEYDLRGEIELQWNICDGGSCVPAGPRKKVSASGTVIPVTAFGRPSYKVSSIVIDEVSK